MKCPNCGFNVTGKFCTKCGKLVEKFYQKTWFIILMLFVFAPIGIAMMWGQRKQWSKNVKIAASAGAALVFLSAFISGGASNKPDLANALVNIGTEISSLDSVLSSETSVIVNTTAEPTTEKTTKSTTTEPSEPTTTATTAEETTKATTTLSTTKETTKATTTKTTTQTTTAAPTTKATTAPTTTKSTEGSSSSPIVITGASSTVSPGEFASITIKATPNTPYDINVYYSSGVSESQDLYDKTSDSEGVVSWTWKVGTRTKPGTYRILIKGNGETITTYFTVQ